MHIAIITAGGAGMFCGTCMHDNTWSKSLIEKGIEVSLIPTYTPIRVDEENRSLSHVYMGGINIYLDYQFPFWQKLPQWTRSWLDHPKVLDFVTRFGISNDAAKLGPMTLAMLEGENGPNRREIDELIDFIANKLKPEIVCLSNSMLVGLLSPLRKNFQGKIVTLLQGEDIFLDQLVDPYREKVISSIQEQAKISDAYLVHSQYYRDFMKDYLCLEEKKIFQIPLGIDLVDHDGLPKQKTDNPFTIGYLARVCPEKGLHNLIEAFVPFHQEYPDSELKIAGYLEKRNRKYLNELLRKCEAVEYVGSPATHQEKITFLKTLDLFSVPTDYQESKGISIIEAMANGIPVVQPAHGIFPEVIEKTGGGITFPVGESSHLQNCLKEMYLDSEKRNALAEKGHQNVRQHFGLEPMADQSIQVFEQILNQ